MEQIVTLGESAELILNQETLQQIGVGAGDQIEIKIANGALTIRALAAAERAKRLAQLTREIFDERREAYLKLAEGPQ